MLAKWLDSGADIFIFDEPTHGIDVEGKEEGVPADAARSWPIRAAGVIFVSSEFNELTGGPAAGSWSCAKANWWVSSEGVDISEGELVDACYSHEAEPLRPADLVQETARSKSLQYGGEKDDEINRTIAPTALGQVVLALAAILVVAGCGGGDSSSSSSATESSETCRNQRRNR